MKDLEGTLLKGYKLEERIGSGGFGAVYRAKQTTVGREVAIKIILPNFANNPDFIRRFEAEAYVIARLEHPHITPLHDYWRDPDGAYLVMRYLRGGSVRQALEHGAYDIDSASHLLEQIASALDFAHRNNIIHRDIKPGNILLDEDDNAYLADFGIAKDLSGVQDNKTEMDAVVGSLDYISPEQARSEAVTPRTDIYSLGVTLYEMITGEHPFKDASSLERLYKHINEPLPEIETLPPELCGEVNAIIQRATAKDPDKRYPDVLALAVAFRKALGKSPEQELKIIEQLTLREHEILGMIADGKSNREIADKLVVTMATVKWHVTQLYKKLHVRNRVQAIVRAREMNLILAGDSYADLVPNVGSRTAISLPEPENPYKGLHAFQTTDARDFFGREELSQRLVEQMQSKHEHYRFLAVVGPSGSGKSSLVKAGLVPALWKGAIPSSEKWFIVDMIPGTHPLDKLETALIRVAANQAANLREQLQRDERGLLRVADIILPNDNTELLIIVDQFEELFTLNEDETSRKLFLDLLRAAVSDARSRVRIVITLRADYYDRPLLYPEFGELLRNRMETVLPLSAKGLERAIRGPAERVGVTFEQGLVEQIVSEMNYQAGALPLLQYALTELFDRREGRIISHKAYQTIGGAVGALANRAEEIYQSLSAEGKELVRQMFMRLVTLGEGAEDSRRRAYQHELLSLTANSDLMEELIEQFAAYRLLSLDHDAETRQAFVEVAHEAILREWERLRTWIDDSRVDLRLQRQLASLVLDWQNAQQDKSYLVRGSRLKQFAAWAQTLGLLLTPDEKLFLELSLKEEKQLEEKALSEQAQQLETQRQLAEQRQRAAQNLRILVGALLVFLVILAGFLFLTIENRNTIARESDVNRSLVLAGDAEEAYAGGQTDLALLLALEATNIENPPPRSIQALSNVAYGMGTRAILTGHSNAVRASAFSSDSQTAITGSCAVLQDNVCNQGELIIWDMATASEKSRIDTLGHRGWVNSIAFHPNGQSFVTASSDNTLILWDANSLEPIRSFVGHSNAVNSVVFSLDGAQIISASSDATAILWDTETGASLRTYPMDDPATEAIEGHSAQVNSVSLSPDGRQFVTASNDRTVLIWNVETGAIEKRLTGHRIPVQAAVFVSNSQVVTAADGRRSWDLGTAGEEPEIRSAWGQIMQIESMVVSSDGDEILFNEGFLIGIGSFTAARNRNLFWDSSDTILTMSLSPNQRYLLAGSFDSSIRVWNYQPSNFQQELQPGLQMDGQFAISPSGRYVAIEALESGGIFVYDLQTRQEINHYANLQGDVIPIEFVSDEYLLFGGGDYYGDQSLNYLVLWNFQSGESQLLEGYRFWIRSAAFSPDRKTILIGSQNYYPNMPAPEGELFLWDIDPGSAHFAQIIQRFPNTDDITGIDFSSDGRYVVTSSGVGQNISLWDVQANQLIHRSDFGRRGSLSGVVYDVEFTPDDQMVLAGFIDSSIKLIDPWTSRIERNYIGHDSFAFNVTISADGSYMASVGGGTGAIVWDMATGGILGIYPTRGNQVLFSPDGQSLFAVDNNTSFVQWAIPSNDLSEIHAWIAENRYLSTFSCQDRERYQIEPYCME